MEYQGERSYKEARLEVLGRFDKEFIEKYKYDNLFYVVVESLIMGRDPYYLLQHCVESHATMFEKLKEVITLQPPPVRIFEVPIGYKLVKNDEA